jgi:hypothetical protein
VIFKSFEEGDFQGRSEKELQPHSRVIAVLKL